MNNVKNENIPIEIPNREKTNMKNIKSVGDKNNSLEMSHLGSFIDNENKTDNNNKVSNIEADKHLEGSIIHDNSYIINASNVQAINNNISKYKKSNSKIQKECAETKSLFSVELKDYFFSKFFKRKSTQFVKYELFQSAIKDKLSIEFILEAIND